VEIDFFAISKFVEGPRVSQCTRTSKVLIRHCQHGIWLQNIQCSINSKVKYTPRVKESFTR